MADEMSVGYITREGNIGLKRVIFAMLWSKWRRFCCDLDAGTRPFPTILENTLGLLRFDGCMGSNATMVF